MVECEIRFIREELTGLSVPGAYLRDAAHRCGVKFDAECDGSAGVHYCTLRIDDGAELLSEPTSVEMDYLSDLIDTENRRLACQTRIERVGVIEIVTMEKEAGTETETTKESDVKYRKDFADLPLEKKIYQLVQLEAMALSETISFVLNSPFSVGGKLVDVLAEFGFKLEAEERAAKKPNEHKSDD